MPDDETLAALICVSVAFMGVAAWVVWFASQITPVIP